MRNLLQPQIAETEAEIEACYPVMHELRPSLSKEEFVSRVQAQRKQGYELAYVEEEGQPVAIAGYRVGQNLAWGKFLYVDDLVTASEYRSRGHGATLLRWLQEQAVARGCDQLHLDSGVQRLDAHRFYQREGMEISSYHFKMVLS
jgi:GNAT superfamily N-acetyltransferase